MARPKKEGLEYFPHDTDAVNDEKVEALRMIYGNNGYAFYFILLERIYRTKNAELDVSDAETIQILSKKVGVTEQEFGNMLTTALKRDCFDKEHYEKRGVLTSNGIKKRVMPVLEKRESMRNKYASDKKDDFLLVSDAETKKELDKVKESKVKESNKEIIPFDEIINYLNEKAETSYRSSSKKTQQHINARVVDGFTLNDFKTVIDKKVAEWINDKSMIKYIRPETLFGTKFESYLNQKTIEHGADFKPHTTVAKPKIEKLTMEDYLRSE